MRTTNQMIAELEATCEPDVQQKLDTILKGENPSEQVTKLYVEIFDDQESSSC